jgi:predicted Zn-dependent protease
MQSPKKLPKIFCTCLLTMICTQFVAAQNPAVLKTAQSLQKMFDNFAENAGPMAPMFGKLTPEQLQKLESIKVTPTEESQFGQRVLDAYLQRLKESKVDVTMDGKELNYVRQLIKLIKPLMKNGTRYKSIDVRLIERPEMDAFSIPGGRLLLTRGMVEDAGSEATLVGVLAHELSHLDRGHQLLPLKQSKLSNEVLDFKDQMMWISLISRPARSEQESEADADATLWMMKLGYDPRELVKLLTQWSQRQDQVAPWLQFVPGFVKSHPDAGIRAQKVAELADRLSNQYPHADFIGADNLEKRTPRLRQVSKK